MPTPRADSYTAVSGGVYGGRFSPQTFLSTQPGAGSYNPATFTWTPAKGSDGRVTQESFDSLPTGVWISVASTSFTGQVQPLLTAAMPTYNDPGTGDLAKVVDAYSGFAHDEVGGRLFAHGGGHADSANNGIYRLDIAKMQWAIAKLPDLSTAWDAAYNSVGTFTGYPRAEAYCWANPTTTTIYGDEFYDETLPAASTGNPTARHTYQAMTFYDGKLRHGVRRYWEWDETTGIWTKKYPLGKNFTTHTQSGGGYAGEHVKGTWDEVKNRYILTPAFTGAPEGAWAYNTDSDTWSRPSFIVGGWQGYGATMSRRGRQWGSFTRPTLEGYFWPPYLVLQNLDTDTANWVPITGLTQSRCVSGDLYDEATTMTYCGANDKFLALFGYDQNDAYAAGSHLPLAPFWIDPETGSATYEAQTGAFPTLSTSSLIENKFVYVEQLRCLLMVSSGAANIIIRKF